jgi:hypothetical protein
MHVIEYVNCTLMHNKLFSVVKSALQLELGMNSSIHAGVLHFSCDKI